MKHLCIETTYSKIDPLILLFKKGKYYEEFEYAQSIRLRSEHIGKVPLLRIYSKSFLTPSPIGIHIYHTFKYLFT